MFALPEKVTIWNRVGGGSYYGYTWSEPKIINARYALRVKKVIDTQGADVTSEISVYFNDTSVNLDTKILIGESAELSPPAQAKDVINFAATPSGTSLRVAYL